MDTFDPAPPRRGSLDHSFPLPVAALNSLHSKIAVPSSALGGPSEINEGKDGEAVPFSLLLPDFFNHECGVSAARIAAFLLYNINNRLERLNTGGPNPTTSKTLANTPLAAC